MKTKARTLETTLFLAFLCIFSSCRKDEESGLRSYNYNVINNYKTQAINIFESTTYKALYIETGNENWYCFTPEHDSLKILSCYQELHNELVMELYNKNGEFLCEAKNNGDKLEITYVLESIDRYYLKISLKEGAFNTYSICWNCYKSCTFNSKYVDIIESNYSIDEAYILDEATLYSPLSITNTETDWYKIITDLPQIVVNAEFTHEFGDIDMLALSMAGDTLAESSSLTNNEQLIINLGDWWGEVEVDTCFIRVGLYSGEINTYSLLWNSTTENDSACGPPDNFSSIIENHYCSEDAIFLKEYNYYNNISISNAHSHWYKLCTSASHLKILCNFNHNNGNINMELLSYDKTLLDVSQSNDDNEKIQYIAYDYGMYYLRVYSTSNKVNTYNIWWDDAGADLFDN